MKYILIVLTMSLCPSCLTTMNCGKIDAALNKPEVGKGTRASEFTQGILLFPFCLVGDIILSPIEAISYSEDRPVHSMTWNFKLFYEDGYNSVETVNKKEDNLTNESTEFVPNR